MTTIELGNIGSKEQAEKIIKAVDGKTFMNFKVDYTAMMGNYPVSVSSDYDGTEKEITEMLLFTLATSI